MKPNPLAFGILLLAVPVSGEVQVFVEDIGGKAVIKYTCTGGEVVRAFSLDVTVSNGGITAVSDFFVGESTSEGRGYGFFPASYRDSGFDWDAPGYAPLGVVADAPGDTLPGLGTAGVTLELGGLWQPGDSTAVPAASGVLCALTITEAANVALALNVSRGGLQFASVEETGDVTLTGGPVNPGTTAPRILSISETGDIITVLFEGGELFWSTDLDPPWTPTGDTDGSHSEPVTGWSRKFFRVQGTE